MKHGGKPRIFAGVVPSLVGAVELSGPPENEWYNRRGYRQPNQKYNEHDPIDDKRSRLLPASFPGGPREIEEAVYHAPDGETGAKCRKS